MTSDPPSSRPVPVPSLPSADIALAVRMQYALDAHGQLARATDAPKGVLYTCLDCATPVKLRRGEIRAPHFSHTTNMNCTGEGVLHHAAKLVLAQALRDRERPFTLLLPCVWPGCPNHVPYAIDRALPPYKDVQTEFSWEGLRFDVAVLLHGTLEMAFEIYHHHRVPPEKAARGLPSWIELLAQPLLDDPYTWVTLKDDVPLHSQLQALAEGTLDPAALTEDAIEASWRYRAHVPGHIIYEVEDIDDVRIAEFSWATCEQHARSQVIMLDSALAERDRRRAPKLPRAPVIDPLDLPLSNLRRTAEFASRYYAHLRVPAAATAGLWLRACKCPHCAQPAVFVMDTYVRELRAFGFLLDTYEGKTYNRCGHCRRTVTRRALGSVPTAVSFSGDLVVAQQETQVLSTPLSHS